MDVRWFHIRRVKNGWEAVWYGPQHPVFLWRPRKEHKLFHAKKVALLIMASNAGFTHYRDCGDKLKKISTSIRKMSRRGK